MNPEPDASQTKASIWDIAKETTDKFENTLKFLNSQNSLLDSKICGLVSVDDISRNSTGEYKSLIDLGDKIIEPSLNELHQKDAIVLEDTKLLPVMTADKGSIARMVGLIQMLKEESQRNMENERGKKSCLSVSGSFNESSMCASSPILPSSNKEALEKPPQ